MFFQKVNYQSNCTTKLCPRQRLSARLLKLVEAIQHYYHHKPWPQRLLEINVPFIICLHTDPVLMCFTFCRTIALNQSMSVWISFRQPNYRPSADRLAAIADLVFSDDVQVGIHFLLCSLASHCNRFTSIVGDWVCRV